MARPYGYGLRDSSNFDWFDRYQELLYDVLKTASFLEVQFEVPELARVLNMGIYLMRTLSRSVYWMRIFVTDRIGRITRHPGVFGPNTIERIAALFTALSCLIVFLSYLSNVHSGPFEDDFGQITMATATVDEGLSSIWTDAFGCFFFRPFNMGLLALSLMLGSWAVTHGAALVIHVLLSVAVTMLTLRLFPAQKSRWWGIALGCAFFVHQGNTTAVLQLDTLSQVTSDFFSLIALLAALAYCLPDSGRPASRAVVPALAAASVASLLAMLGKEGGVSAPLAVVATVALFVHPEVRLRRVSGIVISQAVACVVYFVWRLRIHNLIPPPEEVHDRYSFGLSLETFRNFCQFVFVEIVPWNSASLIWNRRAHEWAIGLALAALIVVAAGLGWRRLMRHEPRSKTLLVWLVLVFLIWCTPYVFLMKVSEQEVYRLAAITVMSLGFGCWVLLRSGVTRLAVPVMVIWCAWITVSAIGSVQKCELLKHNAGVVDTMLERMSNAMGNVSQTQDVWVFVTPSVGEWRRYSVVYVPEPALRARAPLGLPWYLGKGDLNLEFFLPQHAVPEYRGNPAQLKKLRIDIQEGRAELMSN